VKSPHKLWLLLAVVVFVLAGCAASVDPADQVVGAAKKTLALHWVRYNLTFERPHLFDPSIRIVGGRAAYNLDARLGFAFLDLQRRGNGSQTLWFDLTPTSLLVDPEPPPSGTLPPGLVWISTRLSGAETLAGQAEGLGPELPLDEIAWGAQKATHVGSSVAGHVPMDEYRVTVDLRTARAAAERLHLNALAAAIRSELRASASPRLSLRVWLNGPGYVSRIDHVVPGAGLGTVSLTFTSFRLRYTGTLPSSSQTVPLAGISPGARSVWEVATGS
jgi:hypothetical protein